MQTVDLTKFKLNKTGAQAVYTEGERHNNATFTTEVDKKFPYQPEDELLSAFDELVPHLVFLCEYADEEKYETTKELILNWKPITQFAITGIVVKESGCMLIGRRTLRGKKVLNLTTPFVLWETSEGMEEYSFMQTLKFHMDEAHEQALAYIGGNYKKESAQLDLFAQTETLDA